MAEQISFYNATQLPPEVAAKLKKLSYEEQVAQTMLARGMQPVEPVQGKGALQSLVSPLQGVSSLVNAYFGSKGLEKAGKGVEEVGRQYQQGSKEELERYLQSRTGSPARGPIEGAASPSASMPAQPYRAAVEAAGSTYPLVSQLGMADLKAQLEGKGKLTLKDVLSLPEGAFTSQSKLEVAQAVRKGMDPETAAGLFLEPSEQYISSGGVVWKKGDLAKPDAKPVVDTRDVFERNPDGSTKIYKVLDDTGREHSAQRNMRTGELDVIVKAPRVSQTTNVDQKQETAAAKKAGDVQTEAVSDSARASNNAVRAVATASRVLTALDTGNTITGFAATPRLIWNRIADTLGATGKDEQERLANTQQLIQSLAQSNLDNAFQMEKQGQITEAERALIQKASVGDFGMTATELRARAVALDKVGRWRIGQHKKLLERYKKDYPDVRTSTWEIEEPPAYRREDAVKEWKNAPPGAASDRLKKYDKYRSK